MEYWWIAFAVVGALLLLALLTALICFWKVFFATRPRVKEEYPTPEGAIYDPHRPQMVEWIKGIRALAHRNVEIRSEDGLTLRGKYYEIEKGAPIEILFHGYRGTAERDLCGGVYRCFHLGRNALIVDHRASGTSDGRVIAFGVKESRDCLLWVDFVLREIDPKARIILTGISMGAATVMTAAGEPLPPNVIGVLADCGYTSARAIIEKVMRDMKLPPRLLYPFVRLGAILFGRFDPDAVSPIEGMRRCHLPVIFFHGDTDDYVPASMSEENYNACASAHKRLVITPGAGHGLCFPHDQEAYFRALTEFFTPFL